ncbi:MAG: hypothetical protein RDV41_07935, partial [Planctomycetota bacterium]|nr:hypothetical protein [Planctomycetota bacterium]
VARSDGSLDASSDAGTSQRNHIGAFITGYEPYWTAPFDNYAYNFSTSNMTTAFWSNATCPIGASVNLLATTEGSVLTRRMQYSRFFFVSTGNRLCKLLRSNPGGGQHAADGNNNGEEWYDCRILGKKVATPFIGSSDRRVFHFGTEGGFVYAMNDNNDENVGDSNTWNASMGLDGKPVSGYPYRIVGGDVLGFAASGGGGGTRMIYTVGQTGQVRLYCFQLPP